VEDGRTDHVNQPSGRLQPHHDLKRFRTNTSALAPG
jgi:hypothetical protein